MELDAGIDTKQIEHVKDGLLRAIGHLEELAKLPQSSPLPICDDDLLKVAEGIVLKRRRREKFFQTTNFGEPAWDIMLDLFIAKLRGRMISVSSACIAAAVPPTTALRYIFIMTQLGQIQRLADPNDARKVYVMLSDEMMDAMRRYLADTLRMDS
jgi:DNA-binding MarR family transcriptional regulator